MKTVGIVCALPAEARHFDGIVNSIGAARRLGDSALITLAGMGIGAAARAAEDLARVPVHALVSFGMAGGLDPALTAGTVCLPAAVMGPDGSTTPTAKDWVDTLAQTLRRQRAFRRRRVACGGRLLSVSEPIATAQDKARFFRNTGAQAVDMESVGIARVAAATGLPFIAVRVITDTAVDSLPAVVLMATRGATQGKELRYGAVLGAVLMSPRQIPAVAMLGWRYWTAHRTLGDLAAYLELAACPEFPARLELG